MSSSEIRRRIVAGDLTGASELLGRPYAVVGEADGEGRVSFDLPVALPPPGRYATDGRELVVTPEGVRLEPPTAGRLRLSFEPD